MPQKTWRDSTDTQKLKVIAWRELSRALRMEWARDDGFVQCVTCGGWWKWNDGTDCGHFLAGRRASILLWEPGIAPQCKLCNGGGCSHKNIYAGATTKERVTIRFTMWMMEHRGREVIEEAFRLKDQVSKSWTAAELKERIESYLERQKVAKKEKGL